MNRREVLATILGAVPATVRGIDIVDKSESGVCLVHLNEYATPEAMRLLQAQLQEYVGPNWKIGIVGPDVKLEFVRV